MRVKAVFISLVLTIAIVMAVAGLVAIFAGLRRILRARLSRNWNTTTGTIVASKVVKSEMEEESNGEENGHSQPLYSAEVTYSYEVGGEKLTGRKIRFDDLKTSSSKTAQAVAENYQIGKSVTVYYDPRSFNNAVLEPGVTWASTVYLVAGLMLVALGAGMSAIIKIWFWS